MWQELSPPGAVAILVVMEPPHFPNKEGKESLHYPRSLGLIAGESQDTIKTGFDARNKDRMAENARIRPGSLCFASPCEHGSALHEGVLKNQHGIQPPVGLLQQLKAETAILRGVC